MKCRKCSKPAVINMRQHKLALCGEHFLEWIPAQTQRFIEKYEMFGPRDTILVAVSGGKDSLSLWDVLLRLGYEAQGLYIDLGISEEGYSSSSLAKVDRFVGKREGARLKVVDVKEVYGKSIPQLARERARAENLLPLWAGETAHNERGGSGGRGCLGYRTQLRR